MFGKLPALGDFVSRGIEREFRDRLDQWLSAEMLRARAEYDDFEQRYDTAPAWNFVNLDADGQWSGGALCASVDRAGRRFPVIMAAPAGDADEATALSGACLGALYDALAEAWDADSLHAAPLVPGEPAPAPGRATGWAPAGTEWVLLGDEGPVFTATGRFPEGIVSVMLGLAA